jgi:2-polyprenyl-3-methyl-5-hydroxy-6-metoxy-1,4-benzoquinol methylase
LIQSLPRKRDAQGFLDLLRLRYRYDAIIGQNLDVLRGARVLDIISSSGFWTIAALDAGASKVVTVETSPKKTAAARKNMSASKVDRSRCEIIWAKVNEVLSSFEADQFDVVLCKRFFEHCFLPEFFDHMSRLKPKHIIVDTGLSKGDGSLCRFSVPGLGWKGAHSKKIVAAPTEELVRLLCGSEFKMRMIDWNAMNLTDWTGIHDYETEASRTFVLDRV